MATEATSPPLASPRHATSSLKSPAGASGGISAVDCATPFTLFPAEYLHSLVTPLHTGTCTNKSFRHLVSAIERLSFLPHARQVFLVQLARGVELIVTNVQTDLVELERVLKLTAGKDLLTVQKLTLERFTPADSSQSRLLRLLKTLDYLLTRSAETAASKKAAVTAEAGRDSITTPLPEPVSHRGSPAVSENAMDDTAAGADSAKAGPSTVVKVPGDASFFCQCVSTGAFTEVWRLLNECLNYAHDNPKMILVATVLLPLIECLMIAGKYLLASVISPGEPLAAVTGKAASSANISQNTATTTAMSVDGGSAAAEKTEMNEQFFFTFTDRHRKVLNVLVRNNAKLLRGSFSLLIHNPKMLEFDNKRNYFTQKLHKKPADMSGQRSTLYINVRRQYIFQDSYYQLQNRSAKDIKYGRLSVRFYDEEAADYGGVSREWFQELIKEIVNPNYALFTPSAEKMGMTYQPNPSSGINPSHLLYFKFVGRIIGKAVFDNKLVDCYFVRSVYKHMLGKTTDITDMEAVDPEYHKSLMWILDNDITDVLDLTFSTEMEEFGQQKIVDLKPNGRNIAVTQESKSEYVQLVVENRLTGAIRDQLTAFLSGFHEIIPNDLIAIFTEKELELLISGVPDIDIDDWKNNSEYRGYTATSPQIQWFWRLVRSLDQEERAKLLQFTTGTSKVPLEGFANLQGINGKQKFQIHRDFGSVARLPSAHTCFNQIDMPEYESYEQLKERLMKAMTEGATGFGFE